MKKSRLIYVTSVFVAMILACSTPPAPEPAAPPPAPEPAPAATPAPTAPIEVEAAYSSAYSRYIGGLDLEGATRYTVVRGDMLANISRRLYNNGFYYPIIMMASRETVLDPDRILPGMVLTVPDLQRNISSTTARANIRDFLREIAVIEAQRGRSGTAAGMRELANSL